MQTAQAQVEAPGIVSDEVALLSSLVPLAGARVLELGCGAAEFARKLVARTPVDRVIAFEVDQAQHRKNAEGPQADRLTFAFGGAEEIDIDDGMVDGVVMMKSLHHVPMAALDLALSEVARVLKPGGWFYASEPVYEGPFNDLVKLFHDEGEVRVAAYLALGRAHLTGILSEEREIRFMAPVAFRDFADFELRLIRATHTHHELSRALLAEVRRRFERHMTPAGASFIRPMRVNLMRKL